MLKFSFLLLYDKKFCLQLAMNLAGLGTTTRHHNGVSETRKNTENVKALVSKYSSHNEYSPNAIINIFGLKTWSRCRGSVVACPALEFVMTAYSHLQVNLLTVVLNDAPVLPDDEDESFYIIKDSPQCVAFGMFMIW